MKDRSIPDAMTKRSLEIQRMLKRAKVKKPMQFVSTIARAKGLADWPNVRDESDYCALIGAITTAIAEGHRSPEDVEKADLGLVTVTVKKDKSNTKNKKRGRPTKVIKRSSVKPVRWTEEQWREVEEAAARTGMNPSAFIRSAVLSQAREIIPQETREAISGKDGDQDPLEGFGEALKKARTRR